MKRPTRHLRRGRPHVAPSGTSRCRTACGIVVPTNRTTPLRPTTTCDNCQRSLLYHAGRR